MSNSIASYQPTYSTATCAVYNLIDSSANLAGFSFPVAASTVTGMTRMYNRNVGFNVQSLAHLVLNYVVGIPTTFFGVKEIVRHELYTGCSPEQIAHVKGIATEKAKELVKSYLQINGY